MAITLKGAGSWQLSTGTTVAATLPTHAAGDMLIVRAGCKPFSADPVINDAGWARAKSFADGTVASASDVGSVRVAVFWKVATSAAETNPTVEWGTTPVPGYVVGMVYENDSGAWEDPVAAAGGDTVEATSKSFTMDDDLGVDAGDVLDIFMIVRDGMFTEPPFSNHAVTQTGVTFSAITEAPATHAATTTADDLSADGYHVEATAGPASAAAVVTVTWSGGETGSCVTTRLREGTVPHVPVVLDSGLLRATTGSPRLITVPVHADAIGVVVFMMADDINLDHADSGHTLGGNAYTEVLGLATDTATESGSCKGYLWTGAQMPASGNQTLSVEMAGATSNEYIYIYVNLGPPDAETAIEVLDSDILEEDVADPSISLQYGGVAGLALAGIHTGREPGFISPGTGTTQLQEDVYDGLIRSAAAIAQTTGGTSDFTIGWSASLDDTAMVAAAFTAVEGDVVPPQVLKPDADITTTGWSTAPLFSKVDDDPDSPDGTVITGTAS